MARAPRPLPASLGDVFTTGDAVAAGVTRRRLRAHDLESPFRGVHRSPTEAEPVPDGPLARDRSLQAVVRRRVAAYLPLMADGAFVCGCSAAVLFGGPVTVGEELDVGVIAPHRAPRRAGIAGRKVAAHLVRVVTLETIPVSSPASTWAMLGSELDVDELIRLGDAFVRIPRDERGRPRRDRQLTTLTALHRAAAAGRRLGGAKLRAALEEIRVGAMSPLETDFRLLTCRAGLPEPELDVAIRDATGALLGIADAAYRRERVLVEVEGDHHRTDPRQWARDLEKHAAFTAVGWDVVRVAGAHVRGVDGAAVGMVRAALARGTQGKGPGR